MTVTLEAIPAATAALAPVAAKVLIENGSQASLAGNAQVGGPTADVYCEGESSQAFRVAPGETAEITFAVCFLPGAVAGRYPIHVFVEFQEGATGILKVARTVEASFPVASEETTDEGATDSVARPLATPPAPGLDGVLEQWRLEALEDYIRESDQPIEGGLFQLGAGDEAEASPVRVAVLPGEQGLFDAWWLFSGPQGSLRLRGLQLGMRVHGGEDGEVGGPSMVIEVARPVDVGSGELAWEHFLSCGDWTTSVTVRIGVTEDGEALQVRAESPDVITELGPGDASVPISAVVDAAAGVHREDGAPPPAGKAHVRRFRDSGWNLGVAGEADPGGRSWTLTLRPTLSPDGSLTVFGRDVSLPKQEVPESPGGRRAQDLGSRLWWDAGSVRFEDLRLRLEEFQRFGPGPVGLLLGGLRRPGAAGEIWPPDAELGGVEELRKLSEAVREGGALLGPDLALERIWPLSGAFDFDEVAFGRDGRPKAVPGSGGAYQARTVALARRLQSFPALSGARVLVLGSPSSEPERDRSGRWSGAEAVAAAWKDLVGVARETAGEGTILLLRGETQSGMPEVDGFLAGPRRIPSADSGQTPFPWPRERGSVGGAVALRPLAEAGPRGDWLAVLHGDGVLVRESGTIRDWVRAAWFLLPLTGAGAEADSVTTLGPDPRHLEIRRRGLRVVTNGTEQPWEHGGRTLAPWGFHVTGEGMAGGREVRDGQVCTWVEMDGEATRSVLVEGAGAAETPIFLGAEMSLADPGDVVIQSRWKAGAGCPYGSRPAAVIHAVDDPWKVLAVVELEARQPAHRWSGEVTAQGSWKPGNLPLGSYGVRMVFVSSRGFPLPATAAAPAPAEAEGPYAVGGVNAGTLEVHRAVEGIVEELEFRPEEREDTAPDAVPRTVGEAVDFGWALTDGGFRWERMAGGMRVTPLPDSLPFGITLRPAELGVAREAILDWKLVPLHAEKQAPDGAAEASKGSPLPWDGEVLRWRHDPAVLAYEFRLASGDDSHREGCGPEEPK